MEKRGKTVGKRWETTEKLRNIQEKDGKTWGNGQKTYEDLEKMEKTHWKKVGNVQKNQLERPRRNLKKLKISRGTNYETLEKAGKKT